MARQFNSRFEILLTEPLRDDLERVARDLSSTPTAIIRLAVSVYIREHDRLKAEVRHAKTRKA
jgi:hypothetical protein